MRSKPEIRNPKLETNAKSEARIVGRDRFFVVDTAAVQESISPSNGLETRFRNSVLGFPSVFGFRISVFPSLLTAGFLWLPPALAQNPPRIGYVHPAGGRQGSTFQATIGGQFLAGATNVHVSGGGIEAVVIEYSRPMNQKEFNEVREQLKQLQEKRAAATRSARRGAPEQPAVTTNTWTAADERKLAEIRDQIEKRAPNRQANPAIAERVTLRIAMDADAVPGEREIRVGTRAGFSNPLVFHVGQLPEVSAPTAWPKPEFRRPAAAGRGLRVQRDPEKSEMRVTLPTVINGQIMPGEVDRFRFAAREGQRLVIAVRARALIPYLPDAVPGWFQATLALYNAQGHELEYADDYRFNPDPVLYYEIPKNGDYIVEIKDSIYRGREDFVYRIALGELPFVTSIFPLGTQVGTTTPVQLKGWNLPDTTLTPDAASPGVRTLAARKEQQLSNPLPFAVEALPECREHEPNGQAHQAQEVSTRIVINGRINEPGDTDVFCFEAKAGTEIVAEVQARRLNSPLDSLLRLTDASGRQLALNDDHEDKGAGLTTHHADSRLSAILPADGRYYLQLSDTQRKGGAEYAYRLRVSPPQPDFELRIVPATVNVRGGTVPLTVYALRKDGFTDDIKLTLKNAPAGFALGGARVPAGQDSIRITLSVPPPGQEEPITLHLEGRATIQGREVVSVAVPAEDMMQAFAYRHLVPAKELLVAVSGRAPQRVPLRILSATPVKIPMGGTARVRIGMPARTATDRFRLELDEPPDGLTLKTVQPAGPATELVLECDGAKASPGLQGNLIVSAFGRGVGATGRPRANLRRAPLTTLPAIPFEIVTGERPAD